MGNIIAKRQNNKVSFLFISSICVGIVCIVHSEQSVYLKQESIELAKQWINGYSEYFYNPTEA